MDRGDETNVGRHAQQFFNADPEFGSRQMHAYAAVSAPPERQVLVARPVEIEALSVVVRSAIDVRVGVAEQHLLPGPDGRGTDDVIVGGASAK